MGRTFIYNFLKGSFIACFVLFGVSFLFTSPASSQTTGLVASYSFNEGSGNTVLDSSGNSNNGTVSSPSWVTQGRYGKALQFGTLARHVIVADSSSLDLTTNMTIEAWVYPTTNPSGYRSVIFKEIPNELSYALYARGGSNTQYGYIYSGGAEREVASSGNLNTNTWTHLSVTFNGSRLRFYKNGALVRTVNYTGQITTSNLPLHIGANPVWTDEVFVGRIDEVRIYNRELTQQEITSDMNTPISAPIPTVIPTATPMATATPTPTLIPTATPTPTELPTPTITPTTIPTNTPIIAPTNTPTPTISPSVTPTPTLGAFGILGDSNLDEYRADDNRGGTYWATTFNPIELLAGGYPPISTPIYSRHLNFGPWGSWGEPRRIGYKYNWARSGARMSDMISSGQHTGLALQIFTGEVQHVYVALGINDFHVYNGTYQQVYDWAIADNTEQIQNKVGAMIADLTLAVDTIQAASPQSIVLASLGDPGTHPSFSSIFPDQKGRDGVSNAIKEFNAAVLQIATSRNLGFFDQYAWANDLWNNRRDAQGYLHVGNELINTNTQGNEPHNLQLGDSVGHIGTVGNGLIANEWFIAPFNERYQLNITPFTEQEILTNAGI